MQRAIAGILALLLTGCATHAISPDDADRQPIKATLANIREDPQRYERRRVLVAGKVNYRASRPSGRWGFDLFDDAGNALRCYEWNHPRQGPFAVGILLRKASYEHGELLVAGYLTRGGDLELDWVEYADVRFDTDVAERPVHFDGWGF